MTTFQAGQEAGFSKTVTEADIVNFAGLSGDFNPVHMDREYAKETRFGQRIAHGILTATFLSRLLGMELPGPGSIYVEQKMKFRNPVFIGDTITARAKIIQVNEQRRTLVLETILKKQDGSIVLDGEAVMMYPQKGDKI